MNASRQQSGSFKDQSHFVLWLALGTGLLALGLVITAASVWRQSRYVETTTRLQADSMVSIIFQLEREFLRTRHELDMALTQAHQARWQDLQKRYDILASRIGLLRENPSVSRLSQSEAYRHVLPELDQLLARTDPFMQAPQQHLQALQGTLHDMVRLGPAVQSLSLAANTLVSLQMEEQLELNHTSERQLFWLLLAQAALLLLASMGLWWRHRTQLNEHAKMRALNLELAAARDLAEQANLAKSRFLANMSHELRTPFNGMLGMMHLLEQDELSPGQRERLATAHQSARHLLDLLNDVLDLSALDADKLRIQPEPLQMTALATEVQQWMQALAKQKNLTLHADLDRDCSGWVLADRTRVRQILLNLISNAIKFTAQGEVRLRVSCQRTSALQVDWTLQVQDTGIGMDDVTLSRLFRRFERADETRTRAQGGAGLGLEIARTLAQKMGGDITVQSQAGQGACFTVHLSTPVCENPPLPKTSPSPEDRDEDPRVWHILVAEDNPVNRMVLGQMLRKLGHTASFAQDGAQALSMATEERFDLVLMDVHMPNMDGLDSTRAIRALPGKRASVPIIAVTADLMDEARERCLQAGMNDFLSKPLDPQKLNQAMRSCMRLLHGHVPVRA